MEKEQHCLLLNTRLQNIFTTNTFKPFNIKEIMKKILFLLLFVLTANNNVFSQNKDDESSKIIINLERIFPYGLPKNIKGYVVDHKGKDSLFLDMKFKFLHEKFLHEDEEINYNLVQQIINGKDTLHFEYGIENTRWNPGLLKSNTDKDRLPIIRYGGKMTDIEDMPEIYYEEDMTDIEEDRTKLVLNEENGTKLILNEEGFAKWDLNDLYNGSIFTYDGDRFTTIKSIGYEFSRDWENFNNSIYITYPNMPELKPDGSQLLFLESSTLGGMDGGFYFSHSYYFDPENPIYNRSGIMVNMLMWYNEYYEWSERAPNGFLANLYYAGLLGLPCPYLPNTSCHTESIEGRFSILTNYTYTWAFSDFTKKTKSGETETVELPTEVVIERKKDIDWGDSKWTRTEKKKLLEEYKTDYHPKMIFTFEW